MAKKKYTKVTPLGDKVLVRPEIAGGEKTVSGIIIPDTGSKEKPARGEVVAIGEGKITEDGTRIPLSVAVGDMVVFSTYGFDEVKIEDEEYYLMSESSILAKIS